ncbi:hypothetical protein IMCC3088_2240 [Aequoribacter fuscus]|uniref:Uncharacterized protein n=1 Tax=Aequoribacter fuscus TaxID=2518989 RepID=F3L3P8_9GAMM|nr:hypothetical protein IMCC3088_2240 [Aequoribacter fuscus]
MADNKVIQLPINSVYHEQDEFRHFVDDYLASYDHPEGFAGELVRQIAECSWWLKSYHRDKEHLVLMKMALLLVDQNERFMGETVALQVFDQLYNSFTGQSLSKKDEKDLQERLSNNGFTIVSLRGRAFGYVIDKVDIIDRLIERQIKNIRLLMQSLESLRFAPLLFKKMTLEIQMLEQKGLSDHENLDKEIARQ